MFPSEYVLDGVHRLSVPGTRSHYSEGQPHKLLQGVVSWFAGILAALRFWRAHPLIRMTRRLPLAAHVSIATYRASRQRCFLQASWRAPAFWSRRGSCCSHFCKQSFPGIETHMSDMQVTGFICRLIGSLVPRLLTSVWRIRTAARNRRVPSGQSLPRQLAAMRPTEQQSCSFGQAGTAATRGSIML